MEESSRAAKKACVRRVPRARAKQRPVHVLLFIVFEGWQLRVGERREIEQGIARMHEQLEQREREQWYSGQAGYCATCAQQGYAQGTCWRAGSVTTTVTASR